MMISFVGNVSFMPADGRLLWLQSLLCDAHLHMHDIVHLYGILLNPGIL